MIRKWISILYWDVTRILIRIYVIYKRKNIVHTDIYQKQCSNSWNVHDWTDEKVRIVSKYQLLTVGSNY